MIESAAVQDLLGRWWFNYDEGNFDFLATLLTNDAHFACRTDTGTTEYEEFVRADITGRQAIMEWQREHRTNSPYPLRHNGTNVHIVDQHDDRASFSSYIFVTHLVEGAVANLSSAIVTGVVSAVGGTLQLSELDVTLDTRTSVPFSAR